jgi:hypothetical protein
MRPNPLSFITTLSSLTALAATSPLNGLTERQVFAPYTLDCTGNETLCPGLSVSIPNQAHLPQRLYQPGSDVDAS